MLRKIISLVCLFSILLTPIAPLVNAEEVKTADEIYNRVAEMEAINPSEAIAIYLEGYELYPENERFENYIIENLDQVFNWCREMEQENKVQEAINGYKAIIDIAEKSDERDVISEEILLQAQEGIKALETENIPEESWEVPQQSEEGIEEVGREDSVDEKVLGDKEEVEKEGDLEDASEKSLEKKENQVREEETPLKPSFIKTEERDLTKEELYHKAKDSLYASEKFSLYIKGYELYPDDNRFKEGIASSALNMLDLGKRHHSQGNFSSALEYYNTILRAPAVPQETINMVTQYQKMAQDKETLLTENELYNRAKNSLYASEKFSLYIKGYQLYPKDNRFKEGIASSALNMLDLGKRNQTQGNFDSAIEYYNAILNAPAVPQEIKNIALSNKSLAQKDQLYNQAKNSPYASEKFSLYIKGYELYPNDNRFKEGIASSALNMLDLGKRNHNQGNFNSALEYYNTILRAPAVPQETINMVTQYQKMAQDKETLLTENELYNKAKNSLYASEKFSLYIKGYQLYPKDNRFKEGIASSALNMLSLAQRHHSQGNFNSAIEYYNTILGAPEVPGKTVGEATVGLGLAKREIVYNGENVYLHTSSYSSSINTILNKQMALGNRDTLQGAYPRTDLAQYADLSVPKDINGWYAASREGTLYHLNPKNFLEDDAIYQFLVLSMSAGILEKDMNSILSGQGILAGKGAAFAQASQMHNINELYLISHAKLETGNGKSTLANGVYIDTDFKLVNANGYFINAQGTVIGGKTTKDYKKVYNMFGIGAVDSDALRSGAERAYKEGWFTPEKAIVGGAKFIAEGYIHHQSYKQDTLYKMRWNPASPATHQYATDVGWAVKQARIFANLYRQCSTYTLVFDIPEFNK